MSDLVGSAQGSLSAFGAFLFGLRECRAPEFVKVAVGVASLLLVPWFFQRHSRHRVLTVRLVSGTNVLE